MSDPSMTDREDNQPSHANETVEEKDKALKDAEAAIKVTLRVKADVEPGVTGSVKEWQE